MKALLGILRVAGRQLGGRKGAVALASTAVGSLLYATLGGAEFNIFLESILSITK